MFLARLAGADAFDHTGEKVGRIRDVVLSPRLQGPPRVVGLVLEVAGRHRVFLPIGRITSLETGQVVISSLINMRGFRQRTGESLVFGELLDRKVTLLPDPTFGRDKEETVTLIDVGMTYTRSRDWEVDRLYVRRGGGLRRRGENFTVKWGEVRGVLTIDPDQGVDHLLASLRTMKAPDVAATILEMPRTRQVQIIRALSDNRLADALEELPEDEQVRLLGLLDRERAADVLENMQPDDAADLVRELDPDRAADLLERMEPAEAKEVRQLMVYEGNSAGGMMTTELVILPADATVAEALAAIARPDLPATVASQVYVVRPPLETPTGTFLGTVHFQALLREPPGTLVASLIDQQLEPLGPQAPLSEVTRNFAIYNLAAIAVVDEGRHLLGAVTVDDVIDHMLPENWRRDRSGNSARLATRGQGGRRG